MLQVFIASPSDVQQERDLVCEVLQDWNDRHAEEYEYVLQPRRWEKHATPELGERPQAILNRQLVDSCDILIGIFASKLGTPTGEAASGTVEEIELAVNSHKPVILYFNAIPKEPETLDRVESARLEEYRAKMQARGLYDSYHSLELLKEKLTRHLHHHVRKIRDGVLTTNLPKDEFAGSQPMPAPQVLMTYRTVKRHSTESGYCHRHDYELVVTLRNTTAQTLRDWNIEVQVPEILKDSAGSSHRDTLHRRTSDDDRRMLYPDDEEEFIIPYVVDDDVYHRRSEIFERHVRARAFVAGALVGECKETVANLQNF